MLAAAERLLIETADADAVSIRAVADAVGCTPPSIYLHFADKNRLLFEVCEAQFEKLDRYVTAATVTSDNPLEVLQGQGRAYIRFGLENPEHYRLLFMGRTDITPPDWGAEELLKLSCFGKVVDTVQRCIDDGLIRFDDAFLVACALWSGIHGLTSLLIAKPDFPWPGTDVVEHLLDVLLRGVAR